jgi:hypothetical protein
MGFYDSVWGLHSCFRMTLVYPNEACLEQKRSMMGVWRQYAELNVTNFNTEEVSELDLDDLTSECLLDVILGPEEGHPSGSADELAAILQLDPKLYEYCLRRTSPFEVFSILKENPPLVHARIIRESLDQATAVMLSA